MKDKLNAIIASGEILFRDENFKENSSKLNELGEIEEMSIDRFLHLVLPTCKSVEALLENHHDRNIVSVDVIDGDISYTYSTIDGKKSKIKEAVKVAGGQIDGVLNFRLAWNDKNGRDYSDLDAWAREPDGTRIGYSTRFRKDKKGSRTNCSGQLDVDNTNPGKRMGVENITWNDFYKMIDGDYQIWVHQYSDRGSQGFKAEIEYLGDVYTYSYDKPLPQDNIVDVATITFKDRQFSIKHHIEPSSGRNVEQDIFGYLSNRFHRVKTVFTNYWKDNIEGDKHYFFIFKDNLSGIGFNANVDNTLILRVKDPNERLIKVRFN